MEDKLRDMGVGTFLGVDIINTVGVGPESLDNPAVTGTSNVSSAINWHEQII